MEQIQAIASEVCEDHLSNLKSTLDLDYTKLSQRVDRALREVNTKLYTLKPIDSSETSSVQQFKRLIREDFAKF